jgi:hypothetical protein
LAKATLIKSIVAKKLHRNGTPMPGPEVTIPYGAIIVKMEPDRDLGRFSYLEEVYGCPQDLLESATAAEEEEARPAAARAPAGGAPAQEGKPGLRWERLDSNHQISVMRARVPGGWLLSGSNGTVTFYPDAQHEWDGTSGA